MLPFYGDGVNPVPDHLKAPPPEPILWTFEEATGKNIVEGQDPGPTPIAEDINNCWRQAGIGKTVVFPDPDEFESAIPQSHRKGEKGYHVKAHRGSKEGRCFIMETSNYLMSNLGYLFFTSVGIVYGFKKPLLFFDFASVNSVSYTAVLRNTFNLVIATPTQEIEFGMIDQADYSGINEYVQKHGLQDASMAAERRAKKLNINPPAEKDAGANGTTAEGDGETELQKAERMLEDEEDEDEEDYEPGSEGESEGSGSDSEEEDGEGGEEYDEVEGEEYEEGYEGEEMEGQTEEY